MNKENTELPTCKVSSALMSRLGLNEQSDCWENDAIWSPPVEVPRKRLSTARKKDRLKNTVYSLDLKESVPTWTPLSNGLMNSSFLMDELPPNVKWPMNNQKRFSNTEILFDSRNSGHQTQYLGKENVDPGKLISNPFSTPNVLTNEQSDLSLTKTEVQDIGEFEGSDGVFSEISASDEDSITCPACGCVFE